MLCRLFFSDLYQGVIQKFRRKLNLQLLNLCQLPDFNANDDPFVAATPPSITALLLFVVDVPMPTLPEASIRIRSVVPPVPQ